MTGYYHRLPGFYPINGYAWDARWHDAPQGRRLLRWRLGILWRHFLPVLWVQYGKVFRP